MIHCAIQVLLKAGFKSKKLKSLGSYTKHSPQQLDRLGRGMHITDQELRQLMVPYAWASSVWSQRAQGYMRYLNAPLLQLWRSNASINTMISYTYLAQRLGISRAKLGIVNMHF